jgi:hypothetical protein
LARKRLERAARGAEAIEETFYIEACAGVIHNLAEAEARPELPRASGNLPGGILPGAIDQSQMPLNEMFHGLTRVLFPISGA